jgi:hypothetical protein
MSDATGLTVEISADTTAMDEALTGARAHTEETPIWDALVAELGPLYDRVDTEWVVLEAQAVMALMERQPC